MFRILVFLGLALVASSTVVFAQVAPDCAEPRACTELALEARERGAYELFHDLAWRALQTGKPNDPDLMYLLARAQALSGRRRDAAIMLRRLAEAGAANDAATHEDFRRVRELPDWAYIASLSARARPVAPASAPVASPSAPPSAPAVAADKPRAAAAAPAAPAAIEKPPPAKPAAPVGPPPKVAAAAPAPTAVPKALRIERANVEEAARFSTRPFVPGGFAHDAVSRRLLFGDVTGRRLFVVGEGSDRPIDLVRAESGGFDDVTAIAVDGKRGDLWVASTGTTGGAVHRLQLISGRALTKFPVPGEGVMRLNDLAVTGDGTVVILDAANRRVFVRRPGGNSAVALLTPLTVPDPVSITVSDDGRFAYVAHGEGITHIDMTSRRATPLGATDITLAGFEFIRWHRDALIGRQVQPDGSRALVRLRLNRDRRAVSEATLIEDPASSEGSAGSATISGDDLYYLVAEGSGSQPAGSALVNVRVNRVELR